MTNDLKNFLEGDFIGNNVHSVYTHCLSCGAWGINLPLEKMCGNCTKDTDTYTYYDKETIALHDTRLINFVLDLVESEVDKILECSCNDCFDEKAELKLSINNLRV